MDLTPKSNDTIAIRTRKLALMAEADNKRNLAMMSGMTGASTPVNGDMQSFRLGRMWTGRDPHTGEFPSYGTSTSSSTTYHSSAGYTRMTEREISQLQKQDRLDFIEIRKSQKKYFTNKLTKLLKSYVRNDKLKTYLMSAKPKQLELIKNLVIGNFPSPSSTEGKKDISKTEIDILYDKIKYAVDNDNINSVFKRLIKKSPRYYYTEWETALKKIKRHHRLQKLGGVPLITLTGSTLVGIFTGMASVPDSRATNQAVREGGYIAHDVVNAPSGLLIRNSPVSRQGNIVGKLSNGDCIYVGGAITGEWAEISRSDRSEHTKTYVSRNYLKRNAKGICP